MTVLERDAIRFCWIVCSMEVFWMVVNGALPVRWIILAGVLCVAAGVLIRSKLK